MTGETPPLFGEVCRATLTTRYLDRVPCAVRGPHDQHCLVWANAVGADITFRWRGDGATTITQWKERSG